MKKIFAFVMFAIIASGFAMAQTVEEQIIDFNKSKTNGFVINIKGVDSKASMNAIQNYFKEINFGKSKNASGFVVYKGQTCPLIGDNKYDIYLTTIQKGKKKDLSSDIVMIVSYGYDNMISSSSDANTANSIKNFMSTKFPQAIEKYQLEEKIAQLKKDLEKANKEKAKNDKAMEKMKAAMEKSEKEHEALNKQIEEYTKSLQNYNLK